MPTISTFFGIQIRIYYREHNPPHIHAYYQGFEAIFDIKKVNKVKGYFPIKAENLVCNWIEEYKYGLLENWELMQQGRNLNKIPGADQ